MVSTAALTAPPLLHLEVDETRVRILDVALELIAHQGFAATTTREISERLGFTKAALYYHFRTKDDLLAALLEPILQGLRNLIASADHSDPCALLSGYVDLVASHEVLIRLLLRDPSVKQRPPSGAAGPLFDQLIGLVSGDVRDVVSRARGRAALGCINGALIYSQPDQHWDVLREVALTSACRVLALPIPTGRLG
jgi:AcrR family transcriptional regulator